MIFRKFIKKTNGYIRQCMYGFHPLTKDINPRINRRWVVHRSTFSDTWKYCYFRIPKCANSTVARSLAYYDPDIDYDPEDQRGKKYKNSSHLLRTDASTVDELTQKYYLFTFVRNPYSRLLSAYMDKMAREDNRAFEKTRTVVRTFSGTGRDLTFEAFVNYLEKRGLYENPHWAPQTAMLPVAAGKINFVGRVENLDADLGFVVNHFFGAGVYEGPVNREINRTYSAHKLAQYYDRNLSERVYALYKTDFDVFAYAKDLP